MRFLVDAQLPPALARWLTEKGHQADHVMDHGLQAVSDQQIWDFASRSEAVIITKDEDFARRRAMAKIGPSIIWVRFPNSRRRDLLDWFDKALTDVIEALERGETLIEMI
jgi:predicted nuclease of predicted toxin-antitoxin system